MNQNRPTSAKQIAANRRNAQKSTGPRTTEGRAVSKLNAFKHGILSKQVLVRGLAFKESSRELDALHKRFWDDLMPVGPVEEMLVDQIVTAHWRLRRALMAESGHIALGVDSGHPKHRRDNTHPMLLWIKWRALGDPIHAMGQSSLGNSIILGWLRDLNSAVEAEGALSVAMVENLNAKLGAQDTGLGRQLMSFCAKDEAAPGGEDAACREQKKAEVIRFLKQKISAFQFLQTECLKEELAEDEARKAVAMLPSAEVLEKIQRYETKLERQLFRAMAELERLQRRRKGENIPAPISVNVSDRG